MVRHPLGIVKTVQARYASDHMEEQIEAILKDIRGNLALHGGDVEFCSFDDNSGKLFVRLLGACQGCPMAELTLKAGIESVIQKNIPAVKQVIAID